MLKTREMAYPAPTKGCSKLSPDAAMLFAPFGCTSPCPVLCAGSPKDIAGCDIMKLNVITPYDVIGWEGVNKF